MKPNRASGVFYAELDKKDAEITRLKDEIAGLRGVCKSQYYEIEGLKRRLDEAKEPNRCIMDIVKPIEEWDMVGPNRTQCPNPRGFGPNGLYCEEHAKLVEKAKGES